MAEDGETSWKHNVIEPIRSSPKRSAVAAMLLAMSIGACVRVVLSGGVPETDAGVMALPHEAAPTVVAPTSRPITNDWNDQSARPLRRNFFDVNLSEFPSLPASRPSAQWIDAQPIPSESRVIVLMNPSKRDGSVEQGLAEQAYQNALSELEQPDADVNMALSDLDDAVAIDPDDSDAASLRQNLESRQLSQSAAPIARGVFLGQTTRPAEGQ